MQVIITFKVTNHSLFHFFHATNSAWINWHTFFVLLGIVTSFSYCVLLY